MDVSVRFANQTQFSNLYHYQAFDPDLYLARLTDILLNHRIYCSNPEDFNDPWDCKPYFDPQLLEDPNRSATAEALIATHTPCANEERINQQLRTNPVFLKKNIHEFSERFMENVSKRWGVYCLSPGPGLTLMWSHYSRNHSGICLEFAVADTKFGGAQKVHYQREYPAPSFFMNRPLT